jgi:hypothetical protein
MDTAEQPDPTHQLPRDMYYLAVHRLRASLPPPIADTVEEHVRRDNAAIAEVASLLPVNGEEVTIAVQFVAASARALDALAEAEQFRGVDTMRCDKCTAQAANMMRQSRGFRSLLLRVQTARQKREANAAALDKATWVEHCAIGLMTQAAGRAPVAAMPEPPPPPAPAEAAPPAETPAADLSAEADFYAALYPRRAAEIRACGGVPPNCTYGPPRPELARAIATGTTPNLRVLDKPVPA